MALCPQRFAGEKTNNENNTESDKKKVKKNKKRAAKSGTAQRSGEIEASLRIVAVTAFWL